MRRIVVWRQCRRCKAPLQLLTRTTAVRQQLCNSCAINRGRKEGQTETAWPSDWR